MLTEVRVLNSENNTHYYMTVREDRLYQFYEFLRRAFPLSSDGVIRSTPHSTVSPSDYFLPAPAVTGLSTIFAYIPQRFPIQDLITWLRQDAGQKYELAIDMEAIEIALAGFGQTVPLLRGDGCEI